MCTSNPGKRIGILVLLGALVVFSQAMAGQSTAGTGGGSARIFVYNQSVAFDLKKGPVKVQSGVTIKDVNYAAYNPQQGRTLAYIVTPGGKGPFAGLVFFHWLGTPNGDRSEFLDEAVSLAKQGTISLLIQGFFPWWERPTDARADRRRVIDQTIEVRRALDLLLSQPGVDPKRIGYVGHDYGAMYGGIVAGIENRIKAYVLIAGMGSFSDWSLKYFPATAAQGEDTYRQVMNGVDPINYVSHATPAALLFQFANYDSYIPKTVAAAFYGQASQPKRVKWYDTLHDMNNETARKDRRAWLTQQLGSANGLGHM